ncbi:uncharacterized protein LOC106157938 [Lingula anatina]|uniref:Uncharacterized protein LOC106157938 n=1 Tax=Lingula anatina TaxID=7574 RepID=A0A1S3HT53_LINAN|nr:uncharacterized protein LOC106157938 [Lingula anatina]|eukprot:XP_013389198.1 uncharacterized protein LOC106157938 [Lingula anatina]
MKFTKVEYLVLLVAMCLVVKSEARFRRIDDGAGKKPFGVSESEAAPSGGRVTDGRCAGGASVASASIGEDGTDLDTGKPPEGGRKKRQLPGGAGQSHCPEVCYWIRPNWIWSIKHNTWFRVVQFPWFQQWLRPCYCWPLNRWCQHYSPNFGNIALCAKCTTEWGWKKIQIWFRCQRRWVWVQIPVGCCCGLMGLHPCPALPPPRPVFPW